MQRPASFASNSGPPPAVTPYRPQYPDLLNASITSPQRTIAAAHAARRQESYGGFDHNETLTIFGGPLLPDSANTDRAQFPSVEDSIPQFDNRSYSFSSTFIRNFYIGSQSMPELQHSLAEVEAHTPTLFEYAASSISDSATPQLMTTFPSQLLPSQFHNGLPSMSGSSHSQNPEDSNASFFTHGFMYDIQEPDEFSDAPPAPSILFRSPPPPIDIASRRKKGVRPSALTSDALRSRPSIGPRTVSYAEGLRRQSDNLISSPGLMRRVMSAEGSRSVVSGRIYKQKAESAQWLPINLNGFVGHGHQNIRNQPTLIAGSSLNSSLAPQTPMSPREGIPLVKRDTARSIASPVARGVSFVFNAGAPVCFTTMEVDQNLASPPETPQARMAVSHSNGWPTTVADFQDKQWHFEVPDEPQNTPAQGSFPLELHMPQPGYLCLMSQPVNTAFGQFNPNFMLRHESPQFKNESPSHTLSTQGHSECSFPESAHYPMGMLTLPMNRQKTFQFSNTTAADFSEKYHQ
jgi:hypothetical protein